MSMMIFSRRFWPLFGAQTLGAFADNTLRMATIVAIYAAWETGESAFNIPAGMGEYSGTIVSVAFTLPVLFFSIFAGQIADMVPRHKLIRRLKLIELGIMALAALFFALGNAPLLIATLFLMGTQSAFFSPVRNAVMPQYYHDTELIRANGYYNAALFVAVVVGLGLGGHFVNQEGGRLVVSGLLIGAAMIGALLARATPEAPAPGHIKLDWNLIGLAKKQIHYVSTLRGIPYPLIGIGWFWMVGAIVLANMPNYVREHLDGGDTEMALLQMVFAIGAGVGSIFAGLIGGRIKNTIALAGLGVLGTIIGSLLIWKFTADGASVAEGVFIAANTPLLFALLITSAANGVFAVPLMASLQRRAPEAARAQVMGVSNMANGTLATLGALMLIPVRMVGINSSQVFLVIGVIQVVLLAFMVYRYRIIKSDSLVNHAAPQ